MENLSDTRPNPAPDDTRPIAAVRRPRLVRWLALAMAFSLLLTALAGVVLLFVMLLRTEPPQPLSVTLITDGHMRVVETTRGTVRALLGEQDIEITGNLAVVPALDTAITSGMSVIVDDQRPVTLTVDGASSVFRTVIENPLDILRAAGVTVDSDDEVMVNGQRVAYARLSQFPLPANRIVVRHALTIHLTDANGQTQNLVTTQNTVGDALTSAGIVLYLGDIVSPPIETALAAGLAVTIDRAQPVAVTVDGVTTETRSQALTVGALLAELGVALNGLDYAVPPENTRISPEMRIRVVRVTESIEVETIEVPFETLYQASDAVELDTTALAQAGTAGVEERRTRIRYEDGVEVYRFDDGIVRVSDPVSQIISFGTRIVYRTIDTPEGPREYYRKLRMYATSYHPAALGGDNITSIGATLTKGIVAINPRVVPYGTITYVEGYGIGRAADTGGPRSTPYWIDLGYDDENYRSWSRWVDVYLLAPPPDNIPLRLP